MKILVVVDMQNDFITGTLGTAEAQAIVPNVQKKIKEYAAAGHPIFYTRDTHADNYLDTPEGIKLPVKHCIKGSWGWEIPAELMVDEKNGGKVLNKPTFGSLDLLDEVIQTYWDDVIDEIEFVGLCTDICVVSNVLIFKAQFYDTAVVSVDANCCAGVTPETHEAALRTMEMCQINVIR